MGSPICLLRFAEYSDFQVLLSFAKFRGAPTNSRFSATFAAFLCAFAVQGFWPQSARRIREVRQANPRKTLSDRSPVIILQRKVAALSQASLERFVLRARRAVGLRDAVNLLVTTSAALAALNRQFRGNNQATDVLSFPSSAGRGRRGTLAGEIAISADIVAQNANRLGLSPATEVKILALHGILHLAGFDHERDNGRMARKETQLRRLLKLPVGLIERTRPGSAKPVKKRHATHRSGTRRRR